MRQLRTCLGICAVACTAFLMSCSDDSIDLVVETPETYEFTRNDQSTVSYPGQTDRLSHLEYIEDLLRDANAGGQIDGQDLLDMFTNAGGDGGGHFGFTSTKQLSDKTSEGERIILEGLMSDAGTASVAGNMGTTASNGIAGLLTRVGSGSTILVNEKGQEFKELIEKGVMGATFYYQMTSVYLTDARIGNQVNNETPVEGENYTDMEHHWDEAFGYFGVPVDFSSNWPSERNDETSFIGSYTRGRDALTGSGDKLMNAFKKGRNAIVLGEYAVRDEQRDILYEELELVFAATAIHYLNAALAASGDPGEFHHTLTEAYGFIRGLSFSPRATLDNAAITQLLKDISDDNFNFWNATQSGLNNARNVLSSAYGLDDIKDDL